jgi:hypothetical protein
MGLNDVVLTMVVGHRAASGLVLVTVAGRSGVESNDPAVIK